MIPSFLLNSWEFFSSLSLGWGSWQSSLKTFGLKASEHFGFGGSRSLQTMLWTNFKINSWHCFDNLETCLDLKFSVLTSILICTGLCSVLFREVWSVYLRLCCLTVTDLTALSFLPWPGWGSPHSLSCYGVVFAQHLSIYIFIASILRRTFSDMSIARWVLLHYLFWNDINRSIALHNILYWKAFE